MDNSSKKEEKKKIRNGNKITVLYQILSAWDLLSHLPNTFQKNPHETSATCPKN